VTEGSTSTLWRDVGATFELAPEAASVLLRCELHSGGADNLEATWDALYAVPGEGYSSLPTDSNRADSRRGNRYSSADTSKRWPAE
jgi:hypothetical protein